MENQEMYKLGFELALKQAGIVEMAEEYIPTFMRKGREWLGLTQGTAGGRNVAQNLSTIKKYAPPARGAKPVQVRMPAPGKKPVKPANWGKQPDNPYSVFSNA